MKGVKMIGIPFLPPSVRHRSNPPPPPQTGKLENQIFSNFPRLCSLTPLLFSRHLVPARLVADMQKKLAPTQWGGVSFDKLVPASRLIMPAITGGTPPSHYSFIHSFIPNPPSHPFPNFIIINIYYIILLFVDPMIAPTLGRK